MGAGERTDGYWVWPEGLAVYVERYRVRLPDEFLSYAHLHGYAMPPALPDDVSMYSPYSLDFWRDWCRRHRSSVWRRALSRFL